MSYKLTLSALLIACCTSSAWAESIGPNLSVDMDKYINEFNKIEKTGKTEQTPELLVFASFSLPKEALKQLSLQVSKAEGVLVFRGMHEGSMKKTASLLHTLNQQGIPAIIHPKLFAEHKVKSVPTFVLSVTDRMAGNVPLAYVLRSFAKEGDNKDLARSYLKKLEVQP